MIETTKTRTLISVEYRGIVLRGTYHQPPNTTTRATAGSGRGPTGVLFLNALSYPRSAVGDSAVHWADAFAAKGYPSIRIDLTGLGDSDGDIPEDLLGLVNSGGYTELTTYAVNDLSSRLTLSGMVVFGLCAGAVSAIYAAAASSTCKGMVLLDPFFFLPPPIRESNGWKRSVRGTVGGIPSRILTKIVERLHGLGNLFRGNVLPKNANFALLRRWKEVTSRGVAVLLLEAPDGKFRDVKPKMGEFDYIKHILSIASDRSRVEVCSIHGTDHSFANTEGQVAVRHQIEQWLSITFPLGTQDFALAGDSESSAISFGVTRKDHILSCSVEGQ